MKQIIWGTAYGGEIENPLGRRTMAICTWSRGVDGAAERKWKEIHTDQLDWSQVWKQDAEAVVKISMGVHVGLH